MIFAIFESMFSGSFPLGVFRSGGAPGSKRALRARGLREKEEGIDHGGGRSQQTAAAAGFPMVPQTFLDFLVKKLQSQEG